MKKLMAMLLAMIMVLSLAACGGEPAAPADKTDAPANELTTVKLAYMPNWGALWAVATADAKGYFAEEGLKIELTAFEDGPSEIAALESGALDISQIGPGADKLCSTGHAEVLLLQHLGDGDCIIGLKGIKTLEELKGKTVGYAAGTASETILVKALESVGMTMEDITPMSMDSTALTTAALSGSVDAVSAWSPLSLTILAEGENATDICSNVDFASLVSPGSWVVNPKWADENHDTMVKFVRAMYKGMDAAAAATTDDAVANEVAGYIAAVLKSDAEIVVKQRYDGSWKTSAEILAYLESGELVQFYADQQATFIDAGAVEAEGALAPADFVLTDIMAEAGK